MRRRAFLKTAISAAGAAAAISCGDARKRADRSKPSFIVFMTDDQRADMLSCAGHPLLRTPAIDALAADGCRFTNHFVTTSICSTSRASIHTGQWASRHGVWGFWQPLSPDGLASTYSVLLREAGWRTGFLGKWGIGGPLPKESFDDFRGRLFEQSYLHKEHGKTVFDTDLLTSQAAEFLRASAPDPFCLTICYMAPHGAADRDQPGFEKLFEGAEIPRGAGPKQGEKGSAPPPLLATAGGQARLRRFPKEDRFAPGRDYLRLLAGVDASVAAVLAALKETGMDERTVLVFTSDNGMLFGEHAMAGKWVAYEDSIRVPLIVRDPAAPKSARGRLEERMTLNVDVAPTILSYAGVPQPAAMQGASVAPLVRGESAPWREDFLYEFRAVPDGEGEGDAHGDDGMGEYLRMKLPSSECVRTPRWKYVHYTDTEPPVEQLFDLAADPREEDDRSADPAAAAELARMRKRCKALKAAAR